MLIKILTAIFAINSLIFLFFGIIQPEYGIMCFVLCVIFLCFDILCIRKILKRQKANKTTANPEPKKTTFQPEKVSQSDVKETLQPSAAQPPKNDNLQTYSPFIPDLNKSTIEEISADAKKHSEDMHRLHQNEFKDFDPFNLDISIVEDKQLTSVEIFFLKYMNGNNIKDPYIAGYWTYEYNIKYKKLLTTFLVKGYLKISSNSETLPFLKVDELKDILRANNLKVSGNKEEIIKRITDNLDDATIQCYIPTLKRKYILTEQGKCITDTVKDSATKNLELEDRCLRYILNYQFNEAYLKICDNELSKNISYRMSSQDEESVYCMPQAKIKYCSELLDDEILLFPEDIEPQNQKTAKACVILGDMLGVSADSTYRLFCRVTDKTYNSTNVVPFFQLISFALMREAPFLKIVTTLNKKNDYFKKMQTAPPVKIESSEEAKKVSSYIFTFADIQIETKDLCETLILDENEATFIATLSNCLKNTNLSLKKFKLIQGNSGFYATYKTDIYEDIRLGHITAKQEVIPDKYAVIKDGNTKATKVFNSRSEAESYIADKDNYVIELRQGYTTPFRMQYMTNLYSSDSIETFDIHDCINLIPKWFGYLRLYREFYRQADFNR